MPPRWRRSARSLTGLRLRGTSGNQHTDRVNRRRLWFRRQAPLIDRMSRIARPAVGADGVVIAAALFESLVVVAREAEALQFAAPELIDVAVVRMDVVGDARRCYLAER